MGQKIKHYLLLFLTIASIIGFLTSGFFAFAHWNEFSLQNGIDDQLVKVEITGIAPDARFLQPMLAITLTRQSDLPLTVVIPQGSMLVSSSGTVDVVTLQEQKIILLESQHMAEVLAYSLNYNKSFPSNSSQYEFAAEVANDKLKQVLNNIVALQAEYETASQLAVWRSHNNMKLAEIEEALGKDFSQSRERVDEILNNDQPLPPPELDEFWLYVALLIFSFALTVIFARFLWKGSKGKRSVDEPKDRIEQLPLIEYLKKWEILAEGGMAKIWTAVDSRSEDKVVVKFPRIYSTRVSPENIRFRFEAEIRHHRKMNHPNIAQFLEAGECIHPHSGQKTAYLIQEFVDGRTIYQLLLKQSFRPFDPYVISNIVDQVIEVLKYMHRQKVIHRDITWKNIMLDHTGQVYLIDFGNATEFNSEVTEECGLPAVGTPLFHAPLDLIGNAPARDFYSLVMLIYVMSAGKLIFGLSERDVERDMSQLSHNLNGVPKSVRKALEWRLGGDFKDERSTMIRKKHFPTVRDMMIEAIEQGQIQTNIRMKAKKNQHKEDQDSETSLAE